MPVIFKRKPKPADPDAVLSELEEAVHAHNGARTERAFTAAKEILQQSTDTERAPAGPRLAALIPACPPTGPRPLPATAAGFRVESGADPTACAEPILAGDEVLRRIVTGYRELTEGRADVHVPDEWAR